LKRFSTQILCAVFFCSGAAARRGDGATPLKGADRALAERDFAAAESLHAAAWRQSPYDQEVPLKLLYAACMNGSLTGMARDECGDVIRLRDRPGGLDACAPRSRESPRGRSAWP
jgi:hypothetical protein